MNWTTLPSAVDIREVGPRDGLQIEAPISTDDERRFLDALVAAGARRIEATAFVSPKAGEAGAEPSTSNKSDSPLWNVTAFRSR